MRVGLAVAIPFTRAAAASHLSPLAPPATSTKTRAVRASARSPRVERRTSACPTLHWGSRATPVTSAGGSTRAERGAARLPKVPVRRAPCETIATARPVSFATEIQGDASVSRGRRGAKPVSGTTPSIAAARSPTASPPTRRTARAYAPLLNKMAKTVGGGIIRGVSPDWSAKARCAHQSMGFARCAVGHREGRRNPAPAARMHADTGTASVSFGSTGSRLVETGAAQYESKATARPRDAPRSGRQPGGLSRDAKGLRDRPRARPETWSSPQEKALNFPFETTRGTSCRVWREVPRSMREGPGQ